MYPEYRSYDQLVLYLSRRRVAATVMINFSLPVHPLVLGTRTAHRHPLVLAGLFFSARSGIIRMATHVPFIHTGRLKPDSCTFVACTFSWLFNTRHYATSSHNTYNAELWPLRPGTKWDTLLDPGILDKPTSPSPFPADLTSPLCPKPESQLGRG